MRRHRLPLAVLIALLAALSVPASADPGKGRGQGQDHGQEQDEGGPGKGHHKGGAERGERGFTTGERDIIVRYFTEHPGIVVPADLPPGIAKNLARGKPLPPGIAKKTLPVELDRQLGIVEYRPVIVGPNVVLLDPATSLVVDILVNVLR